MGFKMVKHLESANYNRKLFYLDGGMEDLPPIIDTKEIQPGSECRSLTTQDKWILNTKYEWVLVVEGSILQDVPATPTGIEYVRISTAAGHGAWVPAHYAEDEDLQALDERLTYQEILMGLPKGEPGSKWPDTFPDNVSEAFGQIKKTLDDLVVEQGNPEGMIGAATVTSSVAMGILNIKRDDVTINDSSVGSTTQQVRKPTVDEARGINALLIKTPRYTGYGVTALPDLIMGIANVYSFNQNTDQFNCLVNPIGPLPYSPYQGWLGGALVYDSTTGMIYRCKSSIAAPANEAAVTPLSNTTYWQYLGKDWSPEIATCLASAIAAIDLAEDAILADIAQLRTDLNTEITNRTQGDTNLQSAINTEATIRTQVDAALRADIDNLSSDLDDEITARANGDAALQAAILTLQGIVGNVAFNANALSFGATLTAQNNGIASGLLAAAARINALEGLGGALTAFDFGQTNPPQAAITEYACVQMFGPGGVFTWNAGVPANSTYVIGGTTHTAVEIPNATFVTNKYNDTNHVWQLNNRTPIFNWVDIGFQVVGTATHTVQGIVRADDSADTMAEFLVNPVTGDITIRKMYRTPANINENIDKFAPNSTQEFAEFAEHTVEKINGLITEANKIVQSDWDESDDETEEFIRNKPKMPYFKHLTIQDSFAVGFVRVFGQLLDKSPQTAEIVLRVYFNPNNSKSLTQGGFNNYDYYIDIPLILNAENKFDNRGDTDSSSHDYKGYAIAGWEVLEDGVSVCSAPLLGSTRSDMRERETDKLSFIQNQIPMQANAIRIAKINGDISISMPALPPDFNDKDYDFVLRRKVYRRMCRRPGDKKWTKTYMSALSLITTAGSGYLPTPKNANNWGKIGYWWHTIVNKRLKEAIKTGHLAYKHLEGHWLPTGILSAMRDESKTAVGFSNLTGRSEIYFKDDPNHEVSYPKEPGSRADKTNVMDIALIRYNREHPTSDNGDYGYEVVATSPPFGIQITPPDKTVITWNDVRWKLHIKLFN